MENRLHLLWFLIAALTLVLYLSSESLGYLVSFPDAAVVSPTDAMNKFMGWFVEIFGPIFKAVGWLLEWPIVLAQKILHFLPWIVTAGILILLGLLASGPRLAMFVGVSALYMTAIGYWPESMNSLAIVLISVPMAVIVGFAFGVLGFYSERARRFIMPMLDLLQTIPAFAYLLPILILFGFGTTVGLVASVLYAFPPMVRNTILGLQGVSSEVIESGLISGATDSQLFWKVRLPSAQDQILLGVNQTMTAMGTEISTIASACMLSGE